MNKHGGLWLFILCCLLSAGCKDKIIPPEPNPLYAPLGAAFCSGDGTVTFFSLITNEITSSWDIGGFVSSAAFARNGTALYVANNYLGKIGVYTLPNMQRVDLLETGGIPHDLCLNQAATQIFLINSNGNFRRYGHTDVDVDTLGVGLAPRRLALKPDHENEVWIACRGDSSVYVVDLEHFYADDTLRFDDVPSDVCFSVSGDIAYVALQNRAGIARLSTESYQELGSRLDSGPGPIDLAINREGMMLVASDSSSGIVKVWNFASGANWTQMDLNVGRSAGRVRFANNNTFYVLLRENCQVVCVDTRGQLPEITDRIDMPSTVTELALWETP